MSNPFVLLLHSRKFWLLILDTAVSLTLFFVGKYAINALEDIKTVIYALQPVFLMLIYAIAAEDIALSRQPIAISQGDLDDGSQG